MGFNRNKVRRVVKEDRLSSLPDELIHKILFCVDMRVVVGTCLLSSRWKLLWTSMPYLNISSEKIHSMLKFDKFVTGVLSHRNHQIQVSSVKLNFSNISHAIVQKIAAYMFSHNVQELMIVCCSPNIPEFIPRLLNFQSLKNFTLNNRYFSIPPFVTPKTPWDFPNLTTLHLSHLTLCDDHDTTYQESVDLFSKCVNLKNLTLKHFVVKGVEVFDIITPRLSNLTLIDGRCSKVINLVAPQLEDITLIRCTFIKYLNAPPGLSSLYYKGNYCPIQLSKNGFHSLNEVTIFFSVQYTKEIARKTINMLQELHSARYLTLKVEIVECISWFPDLLIHHSSPFKNLICLSIDCSTKKDYAYKVKMSTEARNFLLENSPNAILNIKLPEEPPAKAMKQKRAKKLQELSKDKIMQIEPEGAPIGQAKESHKKEMQTQVDQVKAHTESEQLIRLMAQFKSCLVNEGESDVTDIWSKKDKIISLSTRERADVEASDAQELEETEAQCARLVSRIVTSEDFSALEKLLFDDD